MSERLWAGWRMAYIRETGGEPEGGCLFCRLAGVKVEVESLVLERYRHGFLMLNAYPYTSGHAMVAPYAHGDSVALDGPEARAELQAAVERVRTALTRASDPDGFNVGANLGRAAGAGVVGHLHWHVVPRWAGDTNFMPAVAETRVLPETLADTYRRLRETLAGMPADGVTLEDPDVA